MTAPEGRTPAPRCPYRAGWCERPAGHGEDHYTTYRTDEIWTLPEAAAGVRVAEPDTLAALIDAALDKYLPGSHPDLAQAIAESVTAAQPQSESGSAGTSGALPVADRITLDRIRQRWTNPPMGWITKSEHEYAAADIRFLLDRIDEAWAALAAPAEPKP